MESEFSDPSRANSSNNSAVASEDEIFSELDNNPTTSNEIGGDVLDSLQLVVERTKSHFDQEYRAKGANCTMYLHPFASLYLEQCPGLT